MFEDRRKYPRFPIELDATYSPINIIEDYNVAKTVNVSAGGFCLKTKVPVDCGVKIRLILEIKDGECVLLDAQAVWVKNDDDGQCLLGAEILDANSPDYRKFKSYLDYRSQNLKTVT